jgi:energy-coupling factor transporter ATP-binding protein EcfA2
MSLVLYDGPAFSGRSEALRDFAWSPSPSSGVAGLGQYLSPMIETNLSGFANTVRGELFCHKLAMQVQAGSLNIVERLVGDLPNSSRLSSLSGGELVRLIIACTIALQPRRLGLDLTLEQLDRKSRMQLIQEILVPLSKNLEIHIADNIQNDIVEFCDRRKIFTTQPGAPELSRPLCHFAQSLRASKIAVPSVHLYDLSFRYKSSDRWIFRRVNFDFEPGRPYLLKAPNGSGKSTLARILLGLHRPTTGLIQVGDRTFRPWRDGRNLVFYCFQNPGFQLLEDNLQNYLNSVTLAARGRQNWIRSPLFLGVPDAIDRLGLGEFVKEDLFELPLVVKKRITLGASILSQSGWIFFDEPALGLDTTGRVALRQFFSALCEAGFGVIIVTHGDEFDGMTDSIKITISEQRLAFAIDCIMDQ